MDEVRATILRATQVGYAAKKDMDGGQEVWFVDQVVNGKTDIRLSFAPEALYQTALDAIKFLEDNRLR